MTKFVKFTKVSAGCDAEEVLLNVDLIMIITLCKDCIALSMADGCSISIARDDNYNKFEKDNKSTPWV